ncbi:MAG TPA: peroxidase family protein [Gaiellaceae bacterium]|nr:peroxidase family protein [Gaiellaceae bacterium]
MPESLLTRLYSSLTESIDHRIGWDKLPWPLGMLTLVGVRFRLRGRNLFDSGRGPLVRPPAGDEAHANHLTARTLDGTYNDLDEPLMGALGSRFGRNIPLDRARPEPEERLLEPSPRRVSLELMTRDEFKPATTLNLLAGAWIQFEVHDWFSHGQNETENPWRIALAGDDPWPRHPMEIQRTRRDPSADPAGPPTFVTGDTHWWDGSQIYGSDPAFARAIRAGEGGRLRITPQGGLPQDVEDHVDLRGVAGNFWVGLALLHALFMLEHNAICERLHAEYPDLDDQALYEKARLVNAALMAKIHTVDWTPAIIAHPTTVRALRANWWGILGERFARRFGRRTGLEVVHGIPGSKKALFGVPYALTEEFVAVYRMHPLIPDSFTFWSVADDHVIQERSFAEVNALHVRECLEQVPIADAIYSFGVAHPGAISLHNYPRSLQHFDRPDGELLDLAAIDVLRVRERGVPRYNEFRRLFHLEPVRSFEELTGGDAALAAEIEGVYGDVERVDLLVGLYAEPKPQGFGFSDTAFRVFVLMASRRLEADRFFTDDYRPEVYTQAGIDWVEQNSMRTVLLRHFPELAPSLEGVANPFAPWKRVRAASAPAAEPAAVGEPA